MYKKAYIFVFLICSLLLVCCNKEEIVEICTIKGRIITNTNNIHSNGIKITLENVSDPSLKYIVISDVNGDFEVHDIIPGTYSVDAVKDGLEWGWMQDEGVVMHQNNRLVNLASGQIKELIIYLKGQNTIGWEFELDLTDINGNPIGDNLSVPKSASAIAFRLFNSTSDSHPWSINTDYCFVSDDIGYKSEYIFSSVSPCTGTLKPGDSVVIIGIINQKIFDIFQNYPRYMYNILTFNSGFARKEVYLDIAFN